VLDIIHDRGRDAPLAVIRASDGKEYLIVAAEGIAVGDKIDVGKTENKSPPDGCVLPITLIPKTSYIFAIEPFPGYGPKICCSAGSHAQIISSDPGKVIVQLPSRVFKTFSPDCLATVGIAAGGGRVDKPYIKAGQVYWAAHARNELWPRSSANKMNAVDHPFGGRTKPGWPKSCSRWAPPGAKVGSIASRRTGKPR
jgi:large subunit ribosomal protein L2